MNRRIVAATVAILLVTAPVGYSFRAPSITYTVLDLGTTTDGYVPTVTGMNASGQLSGYVTRPDGQPRAVRFVDGAHWQYVPGLESVYSIATAINVHGDLTGYTFTTSMRAFRFAAGAVVSIDLLPGATSGIGLAIADSGEVIGYGTLSDKTNRTWRAMATVPVVPVALATISSKGCGVNANGQIVGSFVTAAGYQHAFRLETGGSLTDVGTLTGSVGKSSACALDADGRIGGNSVLGTATRAFVFSDGAPVTIESFGSSFSSVDAASNGVNVGTFTDPTTGQAHAFVHTALNGASDLNTLMAPGSGWVFSAATAVNAGGQIAGHGRLNGIRRAFRLTPSAASSDTTAPTIAPLSASPSSITPPNKAMVDVAVLATATDDQDPNPVCLVSAIDGHGAPAADFSKTGPLAVSVRATGGATYSITVTCSDAAGNTANGSVDVTVPPDTTKPVFATLTATPSTIWPPKNQTVTVTTAATATDDSGETPTCTLESISGPGTSPTDFNVTGANTGTVKAVGGRTYAFKETCVDGSGNAASLSIDVTVPADVTAPVIGAVTATPSSVTPPNHAMVPVTVSVTATDDVDDEPACALASITAPGAATDDSALTGPLAASVRAVGGRTYSLRVVCSDAAGNSADRSVDVVVPPDTTAPVISALSATPGFIWPPNGKMESVTVSVSATDDVDASPTCGLTSISGAPAADAQVTGTFTASVRSNKDAVYTLHVQCSDQAGNKSQGAVTVAVAKDAVSAARAASKR